MKGIKKVRIPNYGIKYNVNLSARGIRTGLIKKYHRHPPYNYWHPIDRIHGIKGRPRK